MFRTVGKVISSLGFPNEVRLQPSHHAHSLHDYLPCRPCLCSSTTCNSARLTLSLMEWRWPQPLPRLLRLTLTSGDTGTYIPHSFLVCVCVCVCACTCVCVSTYSCCYYIDVHVPLYMYNVYSAVQQRSTTTRLWRYLRGIQTYQHHRFSRYIIYTINQHNLYFPNETLHYICSMYM